MSFSLKKSEPLNKGLKRIACKQLKGVLKQMNPEPNETEEAVHDARKRLKKLRALLRLVQKPLGKKRFQKENRCYRNAGRMISNVRDSAVMVETIHKLRNHFADRLSEDAFEEIAQHLLEIHEEVEDNVVHNGNALNRVEKVLQKAKRRIDDWPLDDNDFSLVHDGLENIYTQGRRSFEKALRKPSQENFHECRKRLKDLRYQVTILEPVWVDVMKRMEETLHQATDYLGDDHDLGELQRILMEKPDLIEDENEQQVLLALITARKEELQALAKPICQRIYAETPENFANRIASYWKIYQNQNF